METTTCNHFNQRELYDYGSHADMICCDCHEINQEILYAAHQKYILTKEYKIKMAKFHYNMAKNSLIKYSQELRDLGVDEY